MKQIRIAKEQFAIVDDEDLEKLSQHSWYSANDYACARKQGFPRISMHRYIMNTPKGMVCDHINGNKLDNRKGNLRNCTQSQNCMNRRKAKGAHFDPRKNKWRGQIVHRVDGVKKTLYLGYYKSKEEALAAYDAVVKKYHGEFAVTNRELANVS